MISLSKDISQIVGNNLTKIPRFRCGWLSNYLSKGTSLVKFSRRICQ